MTTRCINYVHYHYHYQQCDNVRQIETVRRQQIPHLLNSPRLQVVYFMAPLLFAVIKPTITTTITVSRPLHRSAGVSPHFQLRTGGVCWCKLLMATSTFGLGRRRWPSPQQCYLHCLRTVCLRTPVTKRINNFTVNLKL